MVRTTYIPNFIGIGAEENFWYEKNEVFLMLDNVKKAAPRLCFATNATFYCLASVKKMVHYFS